MKPFVPPSPEEVRALRTLAERRLSPDEVRAALAVSISDEERAEILSLIDWFTRRYPTPAARLAWSRRQYRAAKRRAPPGT